MNEHLKDHFISLLFEEYKLASFIWKLMSLGVNMDGLDVRNHHIILDIIGFPADNSGDARFRDMDELPDDYCCRDWLTDPFLELIRKLSEAKEIVLTDAGLKLKEGQDETIVRKELGSHVGWLFEEFQALT